MAVVDPRPARISARRPVASVRASSASSVVLLDLGPVEQLRRGSLPRRLTQLVLGLCLYGMSLAFMVRAEFGLAPWDVLHSGLTRFVPITLGQMVVAVSFVVLLGWLPLREKPGIGTLANALIVGFSADATLALVGELSSPAVRLLFLVGAVGSCGLATALYIGSQLGRGPRDGLMTGLSRRTAWSIRSVRTGLEVAVVVLGLFLGGTIGLGTITFAVAIGPVTQALLPLFLVKLDSPGAPDPLESLAYADGPEPLGT